MLPIVDYGLCCLNYFYSKLQKTPTFRMKKSRRQGQILSNHNDTIASEDNVRSINIPLFLYNICYVLGTEAVRVEDRGSILRDFVAGKPPMAFEASILMHFIHKSALYVSALLKSSIVSL